MGNKNNRCLREDCNQNIGLGSNYCSPECYDIVKERVRIANEKLIKEELDEQEKKEMRAARRALREFK